MEFIEKTTISGQAIEFLIELESIGGEMSRGNSKHGYLTYDQPYNKDTGMYENGKSKWVDGRNECYNLNLLEKSDNGSEYSYIKYKISKRGQAVLEQYRSK